MRRMAMAALLAATPALAQTPAAPATPPPPDPERCDNRPVLMIVSGPTLDRARMAAYAQAIASLGIYQKLGGYYLNAPRPLAVFEGAPPPGMTTLVVRFPCLANARAFWLSKDYQEAIRPLRLNPSAGDYLVTVHLETPPPDWMAGAVEPGRFTKAFDAAAVPQASPLPSLPQPPTGPFSGLGNPPAPGR